MISDKTSYLDQLKFDPKLARGFLAKYLTNIRLVFLLILTIWVLGIFSFVSLPKRLNPEVKIPIVAVTTLLPGAGPQDVEALLTIPIEDVLKGMKGLDTLNSSSTENVSSIVLQFTSNTDSDKAKTDVQNAVNNVTNLPKDAKTPQVVGLDFENQAVLKFALTTKADYASLERVSSILKKRLEDTATVKSVTISGQETQEIMVIVKPEVATTYRVNPGQVLQAITTALKSYPAGSVATNQAAYVVTIDKGVSTIEDLRYLMINVGGNAIKLSDLATIIERPKPNQTSTYVASRSTNATQAITFSVVKKESANIDAAVANAKKTIAATVKPYDNQFQIYTIQDLGKQISKQFGDLVKNYRDTIILVFIELLLFLGIRQAFIACITIPLSFLVSFTVMRASGLTLNFLSLFSLLLSLGLLVDDTIVVVTAMTAYNRTRKFSPTETGLLVWRDFIIPIWTTTISTVWAFLPLLIATGIIGEFIKTIPIVVSSTLYASTAIAVLITLPLMMIILRPQIARRVKILFYVLLVGLILGLFGYLIRQNPLLPAILPLFIIALILLVRVRHYLWQQGRGVLEKYIDLGKAARFARRIGSEGLITIPTFSKRYQWALDKILINRRNRWKTIAAVVIFSIFSYLLVPFGFVVNEFFPKTDEGLVFVSAEYPQGTLPKVAGQKGLPLLAMLTQAPGLDSVSMEVGQVAQTDIIAGTGQGNNVLYTLTLVDKKERKTSSSEAVDFARNALRNVTDAKITVTEPSGGPPAGADVQVSLLGDDLDTLSTYADKVVAYLESQPGVTNATKSLKPSTSKLVFVPDKAKVAEAGVSVDTVGGALRTFASGVSADKIKIDNDNRDITYRISDGNQSPEALSTIQIPTATGSVPLLSLGELKLAPNPPLISRQDGKRTISITAGVNKAYSVSKTNQGLLNYAKSLDLPPGYSYKTGGVNQENQKSVNSILQAMILSAMLILATMVLQFSSFRKAFIVMLVIPLAISGVFIVFALTGTPLSFPALIGMLALFGIVVNNAMMIVDKINRNVKVGMHIRHAISDAAASRLEPILLTSLTTVIGLIPITIQDPLWRGLGGAIIAGLLFSGAIMLFFIPVVYYMWYGKESA